MRSAKRSKRATTCRRRSLEALNLIGSGDVKVVFINAQAAGAETTEVENKAAEVSVPVIKAPSCFPMERPT
jgi:hypothetical protein